MSTVFDSKVLTFVRENALISPPCHVLVGVSGGADSMALLHLLHHWPDEGLRISAVHIHHGLRGESADRDEAFVREYCERNNIGLTVIREDVAAIAAEEHLTIEEAGRQVRYSYFEAVRHRIGADYIATAHTASDQAETLLMHIIRGCGVDGLVGIPMSRGHIIRPLLCCAREEIEEYCAENGISYMVDETNTDIRYTRNCIRHRVLPMLQELNPSVNRALLRLQKHAEADAQYIRGVAQAALDTAKRDNGYDVVAFRQQPSVIRRSMIRLLFNTVSYASFEEIHVSTAEQIVMRGSASVSLPNGLVFDVSQNVVSVYVSMEIQPVVPQAITEFPTRFEFGGKKWSIKRMDRAEDENIHNLLAQYAIDCDKIVGRLYVRSRVEGDYLHPACRGIGKSLKKLMNEWRIPAYRRETYPILCDDKGVVLVPEYTVDERVRVSESTKHYLVCKLLEV